MLHGNEIGTSFPRPALVAATLAAALIALPSCGSGGGSESGGPFPGPSAGALQAKVSYTDDDLRHFLVRTHFGVTNAELNAVRARGVPAYVDSMLDFAPVGSQPFEIQAETLLHNAGLPAGFEAGFPSKDQLVRWWLRLIEQNPNPFQEVMALFWHDHFAVGSQVLRRQSSTHWAREHVDRLRGMAAGNVRSLLIDVSRDANMLSWLDGILNSRQAPNENFAREFWELYTLGVDNGYTQDDISESARAFTGYLVTPGGPAGQSLLQFFVSRHDPGSKNILGGIVHGQNTTDDYEAVVDLTLQNRGAAEYLCTKIFEYFCYEDPSAEIVGELAGILRANNWELRPLLAVLLKSNAFYSAQARRGQIKSPIEHAFGFVRATGMRVPMNELVGMSWSLGQVVTQPPTVEGWPGGSFWLGAQDIVERANFINVAISARTYQASNGFDWATILPPVGQRTASRVVDDLVDLLHIQPSREERNDFIAFLNSERLESGAVAVSPFTASNAQLEERVRGLLYILAQHPTYMTR